MTARTEEEVTAGLMAVLAWAGNTSAASKALKADGVLDIGAQTLTNWVNDRYAARFEELREKYAEQLEAQIIGRYRDNTAFALDVERLALEKAQKRLEAGKDDDPGRTAANAARVAQSNTDKMLSLSGRPTSIREDRTVEETLRKLVAMKVIELPEADVVEQPQITNGGDDGDGR